MINCVFISTENSDDEKVRKFLDRLRSAGIKLINSPHSPTLEGEPGWKEWYSTVCKASIEATDAFVAVVTAGYDSSTWMAHEFEVAWQLYQSQGRPRLFLLKLNARPLPVGLRRYEESATLLPMDPDKAMAVLLGTEKSQEGNQKNEPYVLCEVGGLVDETSVCLAVYGDDLDPEQVSTMLGCQPTSSHRRGERQKPRSQPYKGGAWLLNVRGMAPESPEELVTKLLSKLPEDEAVWIKLGELYDFQLRFGIHMKGWNKGFDLSATLISKVAYLHAKVGFDIYAYRDEDESSEKNGKDSE